jgi:N-acetylglucosaminyl-diphospho-decaprenol L-rhamnosyltransferase
MASDANTELAGHSRSLVSISIVSHRHGALLPGLFKDIERCKDVEVLLTINVPESLAFTESEFRFPLRILRSAVPRGFGANHNAAFRQARGSHFCVLNPDIRLDANPFPVLIDALARDQAGVVAPKIVNSQGQVENNARRFPSLSVVLRKALTGVQAHDYDIAGEPLHADWVAGMFMLFRSEVFREIGGFDERYFLYYEDVDLCLRLRRRGQAAMLEPRAVARHDARRASHRDARHFLWHARSLARFLYRRSVGRD